MIMKATPAGTQTKSTVEEKLGCYRVWARPKAPRKAVRGRPSHMMLGLYPLSDKR
jgi:hypothetical protein